ncbi:hypothetical protein OSTOST_02290 [Ostertagia ostertagi]
MEADVDVVEKTAVVLVFRLGLTEVDNKVLAGVGVTLVEETEGVLAGTAVVLLLVKIGMVEVDTKVLVGVGVKVVEGAGGVLVSAAVVLRPFVVLMSDALVDDVRCVVVVVPSEGVLPLIVGGATVVVGNNISRGTKSRHVWGP